jgi:spore coat protein H
MNTLVRFGAVVASALCWVLAGLAAQPSEQAGPGTDPSDDLFTNAVIRHLQIEIPDEELARLRAYYWTKGEPPEARPTVHCSVWEGAVPYTNVGVHLKGGYGSFRPVDTKPALTLVFDRFVKKQRFHGLHKISLNNEVQDGTYITDKLCRELYAKAGVPAPRADYVTVALNGRHLGLYVLTEGWDKRFLKRHFSNAEGNLYDPVVGSDINRPLHANSGGDRDDASEIRAVVAAAAETNAAIRLARLEKVVDMDRFYTMMALDVMFWNWDGYTINKNNYRVFHDLDHQRVVFMPHGMDQMFWRPDGPIATGRGGLVARAVLGTAEGRRRYLERFTQLRASVFDLVTMTNRLEEIYARIRPAVREGGIFGGVMAPTHDRAVSLLRNRIVRRARSVDEQLAGIKTLTAQTLNEPVSLAGWEPRLQSGRCLLDQTPDPAVLHIATEGGGAACWMTTVWLEEGRYRLEGRIKTSRVRAGVSSALTGAGLRIWSNRKVSDGIHWDWFPYRESRNVLRRGEMVATNCVPRRFSGSHDWTDVTYEIELRQPLADLEVRCELQGDAGEAWFDLKSLRLTRLTDSCP